MTRAPILILAALLLACLAWPAGARPPRPVPADPRPGQGVFGPDGPPSTQTYLQLRIRTLTTQGYRALSQGDATGAIDAFADLAQLAPSNGDASLGTALAYALKNQWPKCLTYLDQAARNKADARCIACNQAAAILRDSGPPGRAAMVLTAYLNAHPDPLDEIVLAAQTTLAQLMTEEQRKAAATPLQALAARQEAWAKLHEGRERWGLAWLDPADAAKLRDAKIAEDYPAELPFLLPDGSALPLKGQKASPNPLRGDVALSRARALLATLTKGETATSAPAIPELPATRASDGPVTSPNPRARPPIPQTAPKEDPPPEPATTHGAAFAIAKDLLVTSDRLVAGCKEIAVYAVDGQGSKATILAQDPASGLALLQVQGDTFKPLALADATAPGPVTIATFPKPTVFQPDLQTLRGQIPAGPKPLLSMTIHPRLAGAPVLDAQGRVVAMLTAQRDDAPDQLPIVLAEALTRFCKDHAAGKTTKDTTEAVVEIEVTR